MSDDPLPPLNPALQPVQIDSARFVGRYQIRPCLTARGEPHVYVVLTTIAGEEHPIALSAAEASEMATKLRQCAALAQSVGANHKPGGIN